ncbi:hypothetical protein K438DRAFT_1766709 [Mycena galopus ATCC 62051]|nr:hypothetical protein K438DRAFT_1766709 [Mycena galopus ATCC 62051]
MNRVGWAVDTNYRNGDSTGRPSSLPAICLHEMTGTNSKRQLYGTAKGSGQLELAGLRRACMRLDLAFASGGATCGKEKRRGLQDLEAEERLARACKDINDWVSDIQGDTRLAEPLHSIARPIWLAELHKVTQIFPTFGDDKYDYAKFIGVSAMTNKTLGVHLELRGEKTSNSQMLWN